LRRIVVPALWALRTHWVTAALLGAAGTGALVALVVVSRLVGTPGIGPRIVAPAVRIPDLQLSTSALATTPLQLRTAATGQLFSLLLLIAAGVLLVATVTMIAVAAARTRARSHELVVHRAVGASRGLLLAAAALEGAAVVAVVLVLGGAPGLVGGRAALAAWPGFVLPGGRWGTVAVAVVIAALLGLGFAAPVASARRRTPLGGRQGRAIELVLPALQLGMSLTVLAAAALLVRHATLLEGAGTTQTGGGELFEVNVPSARPADRAAAYAALLRRLHGGPQERSASLTSPGAVVGLGTGDGILTDCGQCGWGGIYVPFRLPYATHYLVSADTFRMLALPVVAGRGLTDADGWNAPRVAVVNQALATDDFRQGQAVGRRIQIGHAPAAWYTVVGVVADQLPTAFGGGLQPPYAVYLSVLQHPAQAVDLLVRAPGDSGVVAEVNHALAATLGTGITVAQETETQRIAREAAPIRWFGRLFGAEGWVMLAIATLGTFVVMWLWVASVSHDLAVRRAVGARRRDVLRYVLARAAGVAVGGVAFGIWCGTSLWGALTMVVAGLPPWEPGVLLRFSLLLTLSALAGALLPAWRVAHAAPAALVGHGDP
jgi:putative ABC transport system permease protein